MEGVADASTLSPQFYPVGALKIPYFDLIGNTTGFYRIRYLEPLPGFAGLADKPQRYAQERGTISGVYFPPLLDQRWDDVSKDARIDVVITEGERKAAAGCAVGVATIGLGGVDMWRSARRCLDILPPLGEFEWKDRRVFIAYDSDAATNEQVVRAQRQLAKELLERGAVVSFITIPAAKGGAKQGLDDLLVAEGGEALISLMETSTSFPEGEALWTLNEEVLLVRNPTIVIVRNDGAMVKPRDFIQVLYANRHHLAPDSKGKLVQKPTAKRWIEWPGRFETTNMIYQPGKLRVVDNQWNLWKGWGCEPVKGDVSPWKWLMEFVFKEDVKTRRWFERWCAYPLQFPGTKLYTACVFWSVSTGTGKTLMAYTLKRIYGENFAEIKSGTVKQAFNSWAKHRQFIYADEISGGQVRVDADKLKGYVTQEHVTINEKHIPEYSIVDCMNWLFSSNHPDAAFVEAEDRRYMVAEIIGAAAGREKYEWYDKWLRSTGPSHLFHYLLSLDLGDFNPREKAPMTEAKRNMMLANQSELTLWLQSLREDPTGTLRPFGDEAAEHCDLYTPRQLLKKIIDPEGRSRITEAGVGRALMALGFRQANRSKPLKTSVGQKRLYVLRNPQQWLQASPRALIEHWEEFFAKELHT